MKSSAKMLYPIFTILSVSNVAANTSNRTNFENDHNETVANRVNENTFTKLRIYDCRKSKGLEIYIPYTQSC